MYCGAFHVCSSEPLNGNAPLTSNTGVRCEVKCEGGLVNIDPFDIYLCELIKTIGNCSEKKILDKVYVLFQKAFS